MSNAWIGGAMQSGENRAAIIWHPRGVYKSGDIVAVRRTTLTNTYQYFRLNDNINPLEAIGFEPDSFNGAVYWNPINVIGNPL